MYNVLTGIIVYENGLLYKIKTNNSNVNPEDDTDEVYWEFYEISNSTMTTRYGYEAKLVVLCISLLECKERLIRDAFCATEQNPCGNLCDNKKFMLAVKFMVTQKAIEIAECDSDWASIENQIGILKSICCCNGGC